MSVEVTKNGAARFVCDLKPDAKRVHLAGDFNNWDPQSRRMMKRNGSFRANMKLAPGEYQFKYVIDGEWHCDPMAETRIPNIFGSENSVIRISPSQGGSR